MIPSAMQSIEAIEARAAGKTLAFFLDYDGTLTPIADRPELALMSGTMRETVSRLARRYAVAVVSGRDRADVEKLVQVESISYAGSHGFDIAGPQGRQMQQEAEAFVPQLRKAEADMRRRLQGVQGALVESKKYAFAVHYRQVPEQDRAGLDGAVDEVAARYPQLRRKGGKKVYEFLPAMDWDKGKAVVWLLEALGLDGPHVLPFYLGDDLTDEDAFAALEGRGIGLLVAEAATETKASYLLRDVEQVGDFLERMSGLPEQSGS